MLIAGVAEEQRPSKATERRNIVNRSDTYEERWNGQRSNAKHTQTKSCLCPGPGPGKSEKVNILRAINELQLRKHEVDAVMNGLPVELVKKYVRISMNFEVNVASSQRILNAIKTIYVKNLTR